MFSSFVSWQLEKIEELRQQYKSAADILKNE